MKLTNCPVPFVSSPDIISLFTDTSLMLSSLTLSSLVCCVFLLLSFSSSYSFVIKVETFLWLILKLKKNCVFMFRLQLLQTKLTVVGLFYIEMLIFFTFKCLFYSSKELFLFSANCKKTTMKTELQFSSCKTKETKTQSG